MSQDVVGTTQAGGVANNLPYIKLRLYVLTYPELCIDYLVMEVQRRATNSQPQYEWIWEK